MRRREWIQRVGLAALCTAVVTGTCGAGIANGWLGGSRSWASDAVFPRGEPDERVLVVGIDNEALAAVGRWPWERSTIATLVNKLADAGARTVVLDVVFETAEIGDAELAAAMGRIPTVLAWYPQAQGYDAALDVITAPPSGSVEPTDTLKQAAAALGHTVVTRSAIDGVTRKLPLVIDSTIEFRPSLSLAGLAVATGVPVQQIILQKHAVQLGDRAIPTGERHNLIVNFAHGFDQTSSVGYLSAADLLQNADRLPQQTVDKLRNRVVLVGVADENLGDHELTPLAKASGQPGVTMHANALNTMLTDVYITAPRNSTTLLVVLLSSLIISLVLLLLGVRYGLLLAATFIVGIFIWSIGPAAASGSLVDVVWPSVGAALTAAIGVALRYFVADRQRRRASALFRQYVPASVSEELLARGLLDQQVEGVRVEVTTMFCDLRGFTAMTHELGPQVLRSILNHYYEYATEIVERYKGTLMQFVGDEVYAVFGAPLPSDDHQERAIQCAADLVSQVGRLDHTLQSQGYRTVRFGVGVATGSAIAAHVGSTTRRQYTVVGDAVNLGARLCSQALADQVVVSELAAEHAQLDTLVGTRPGLNVGSEALVLKGFDEPYPVQRLRFHPAPVTHGSIEGDPS